MVKILSQAGNSLADVYDAEGSIAGIDDLETRELGIIHEMGATVFSERYNTDIRRAPTGVLLQTITWEVFITGLPSVPTRLLGVAVFADTIARVASAAVFAREPDRGREIPLWVWDGTNSISIAFDDEGTGAVREILVPLTGLNMIPAMVGGNGQPQPQMVSDIVFRGLTTTFGAGNVALTALVWTANAQLGGISSRGLPIPGW